MSKNLFYKRWRKMIALLLAVLMTALFPAACGEKQDAAGETDNRVLSGEAAASLERFLGRFVSGYPVSSDGKWEYDSSAPGKNGGNILACIVTPASCADWTLYSDVPEENRLIEKADDPEGWSKNTYAYYLYDAETVEWIAREIFNVGDSEIASLAEKGKSEGLFYKDGEKYYTVRDDVIDAYADVTIVSADFSGGRYHVTADVNTLMKTDDDGEFIHILGRCRAVLELKTISGREYWSLYEFYVAES